MSIDKHCKSFIFTRTKQFKINYLRITETANVNIIGINDDSIKIV